VAPCRARIAAGRGYRTSARPTSACIVNIDRSIDVVQQTKRTRTPRRYRSVVSGLHASPALISHDGSQEGVAIELTPLGRLQPPAPGPTVP